MRKKVMKEYVQSEYRSSLSSPEKSVVRGNVSGCDKLELKLREQFVVIKRETR